MQWVAVREWELRLEIILSSNIYYTILNERRNMTMTKEEIVERIEEIKQEERDPEAQHTLEDELMYQFIVFVSTKKSKLGLLAKEVLKVTKLDFPRWCS